MPVDPRAYLLTRIRNKTAFFWGSSVTVVYRWCMLAVKIGLNLARNIEKHEEPYVSGIRKPIFVFVQNYSTDSFQTCCRS